MTNLFESFSGADLDRLVACIQRARAEGLTLDKYCQAGINANSGNVYIWSEDWAGCVYCTLGGNVQWSYLCSNCGTEYDFESEAECRAYAEAHNYECSNCRDGE